MKRVGVIVIEHRRRRSTEKVCATELCSLFSWLIVHERWDWISTILLGNERKEGIRDSTGDESKEIRIYYLNNVRDKRK